MLWIMLLLSLCPLKNYIYEGLRVPFANSHQFSHSCPNLCDPWTAACQASLSISNSWSLLKIMFIESVMPSSHVILCHVLLLPPSIFPSIRVFSMSQFFAPGGQSIGISASASVLPMNTQDPYPLGLTSLISLESKGLSRVFTNTTVQKQQFFGISFLYRPTLTTIHDHWINHSLD